MSALLRISSVVNDIRHRSLNTLGQLLLDSLGHDRGIATILGVRLAARGLGVGACVVHLGAQCC